MNLTGNIGNGEFMTFELEEARRLIPAAQKQTFIHKNHLYRKADGRDIKGERKGLSLINSLKLNLTDGKIIRPGVLFKKSRDEMIKKTKECLSKFLVCQNELYVRCK